MQPKFLTILQFTNIWTDFIVMGIKMMHVCGEAGSLYCNAIIPGDGAVKNLKGEKIVLS